jgi:membrane-bound lytic murein transglycosylase B
VASRGWTTGRSRLLAAGLGAALLIPASVDAAAQPEPPTALPAPEAPDLVLDEVAVRRTSAIDRADERLEEARLVTEAATANWLIAESTRQGATDRVARTVVAVASARDRLADADRTVDVHARRFAELQAVTDRREAALSEEQDHLRTMAAAIFASVPGDRFLGLGTFDEMSAGDRREAIRARVIDDQTAVVDARSTTWRTALAASRAQQERLRRAERTRGERARALTRAQTASDTAEAARRDAESRSSELARTLAAAAERQTERRDDRRAARLTSAVTGTDLTLVALDAYWRSAQAAPCRVPWWVLAGVGHVESRHGTAQGSRLTAKGDTTVDILGIPLDGRPGTATIADSDGGRLDRDATWDRAVGPMQFLPGTWGFFAVDGNDDAVASPHNIYDAAAAAGRLLCWGRGELTTDAQYRSALLSYNNSNAYTGQVVAQGRGYRATLDLPDVAPPPEPASPVPD